MQFKSFITLFFLFTIIFSCSNGTDINNQLDENQFEFILYDGLSSSDIREISENLQDNYQRILNDLQIQDMPKVIIKIWSNYDNFLEDMENDIGIRYTGATGYIFSMTELRIFYNSQVAVAAVHEYAHLVSLQVNRTISNNPRWLWEAVALYETQEFTDPRTLSFMVSGNYPSLSELNTDYNNSNHNIYSVGYILLDYIVNTWGMDSVIDLIKNNGNLSITLGIDTQEFESGWYQFVEEKYLN